MKKIQEKVIIALQLWDGISAAVQDFKKFHEFEIENDPYEIIFYDIRELLFKEDQSFFEGEIQDINIITEVDQNKFELLINLVRKYTHNLDLRIIKSKDNKHLYISLDKLYNKNIYYVDSVNDEKKVYKCLRAEYWY